MGVTLTASEMSTSFLCSQLALKVDHTCRTDNNSPKRRCKVLRSFEVVVLTYESAIWVRVLLAGGL